jgi:hypothetical protein
MSLDVADSAVAAAASKVTYGSAAASVIGFWSSIDWLGVLGFVVAFGGVAVNAYFKRRQDRRDQIRLKGEQAERAARMKRDELESQMRIAMMEQGHDPERT